jgi:hypothetical protein
MNLNHVGWSDSRFWLQKPKFSAEEIHVEYLLVCHLGTYFSTGFRLLLLVLHIHVLPILPDQPIQYDNLSYQLGLPGPALG